MLQWRCADAMFVRARRARRGSVASRGCPPRRRRSQGARGDTVQVDPLADPQLHAARRARRQAAAPGRGAHGAVPRGLRPRLPEHPPADAGAHRRARLRIGARLSAVHAAVQRQADRGRRLLPARRRGAYYITLSTEAGERAYPTIFHEVRAPAGRAPRSPTCRCGSTRGLPGDYSTYQMVRRPGGHARPRQGRARLRAPRALHPAEGSPSPSILIDCRSTTRPTAAACSTPSRGRSCTTC